MVGEKDVSGKRLHMILQYIAQVKEATDPPPRDKCLQVIAGIADGSLIMEAQSIWVLKSAGAVPRGECVAHGFPE